MAPVCSAAPVGCHGVGSGPRQPDRQPGPALEELAEPVEDRVAVLSHGRDVARDRAARRPGDVRRRRPLLWPGPRRSPSTHRARGGSPRRDRPPGRDACPRHRAAFPAGASSPDARPGSVQGAWRTPLETAASTSCARCARPALPSRRGVLSTQRWPLRALQCARRARSAAHAAMRSRRSAPRWRSRQHQKESQHPEFPTVRASFAQVVDGRLTRPEQVPASLTTGEHRGARVLDAAKAHAVREGWQVHDDDTTPRLGGRGLPNQVRWPRGRWRRIRGGSGLLEHRGQGRRRDPVR